jgi:hypothetical protein
MEHEVVLARIERKGLPVEPLGKRLPVHGHVNDAEVVAGRVLSGEHEGRHRRIHLRQEP